jgi:hypothetical protein
MLLALVAAAACDQDGPEARAVEGPSSGARPNACAAGGGAPGDPSSAKYFPRTVGEYCVDPHTETRVYGEAAPADLDEACREQFEGECDLYESYGLRRVVTLRYVHGAGSPAAVAVTLSRFGSREAAYGFFTHRAIGTGDPETSAAQPIDTAGAGALTDRGVTVWRGAHVAELSYTNELISPERLREQSRRVLPLLGKALGERLAGPPVLPEAVQLLPDEHRLELGIRFEHRDVLGVSGVGEGAVGYYRDEAKRYRVFVVIRPDEASAEDVVKTLKRLDGARSMKDMVFKVLRVPRQSSESVPRVHWLVAKRGNRVYGVGDEEHALRGLSPEERARVSLDDRGKLAVLKTLVLGGGSKPEAQ